MNSLKTIAICAGIFMAHNASAQNVGIGTATPTEKLHVVGGARIEFLSGVGYRLVQSNATGVLSNIADGSSGQVLTTNGAGVLNFQTPAVAASAWELLGNAGTVNGTNFLGTTDAQDLDIRTGNVIRHRFTQQGQIEFLNTGYSVFIGEGAGANDDLSTNKNVFVGYEAGNANTTGYFNTANGYRALTTNTTGFYNTANGASALNSNTTGYANTANGYRALYSNTTGYHNTANGAGALNSNTTGYYNTANGLNALQYNTTGYHNTANGYYALNSNTTGFNNTALGYRAGDNITTGSSNVIIGYNIDAPIAAGSNQMSIGNMIYATGVNGTGTSVSTGNVGIRNNSPSFVLDVIGDRIRIQDNATSKSMHVRTDGVNLDLTAQGAPLWIQAETNQDVIINQETSGTISTGYVGIGTTGPTEKLHVQGGARITSLAGTNSRLVQANATGVLSDISDGSSGQVLTTNGAGVLNFQTPGGNNTLDMAYDEGGAGAGRIITADAGTVEINGTGGLWVNASTATLSEAVLVNNSDGTNSTDTKIGYVGTSAGNIYAYGIRSEARLTAATNIWDGGYGVYGIAKHPTNGTVDLNASATSSGNSVNRAIGVGGTLGSSSNYIGGPRDIIAAVYGGTGLHNSGNGSVTGGAKLYPGLFQGNGRTLGLWGENSTYIELLPKCQNADYDAGVIGFYNSASNGGNNNADIGTGDSYLSIEANVTDATVKDVVLQTRTTGNVGIGTNAPTYKLQIDGGATPLNITGGGAAFPKLRLDVQSPGDAIFRLYDFNTIEDVRLATNGDSWYNGSGNFGIGTTTPVARLEVAGGRVEFTNTTDATPAAGSGVLEIGNSLRIDANEIITNTNTTLYLQNDNNGDLRVDATTLVVDASTNRVGLGTTAPLYPFHVTTTNNATWQSRFTNGSSNVYLAHQTGYGVHINTGGTNSSARYALDVRNATKNHFRVRDDGNIGMNTTAPTAVLSVNGTANKTGGGTWAVFSDKRLKENITDYSEGLDFIKQVRPVNFSYNDKMEEIWGKDELNKGRIYQGVIAQELQKIAPDMVRSVSVTHPVDKEAANYNENATPLPSENFLEVDPNKFTYALINAVQEQQKQIDAQQEQMQAQQEQLQELMVEIKALKEANK